MHANDSPEKTTNIDNVKIWVLSIKPAVNHLCAEQRNRSISYKILLRGNNNVWMGFENGIYIIEHKHGFKKERAFI